MNFHRTPPERVAALQAIRDRHAGHAATSQCTRLLEAMQQLGSVTTVEAARFLDIVRPPARKWNLVEAGHRILMTWDLNETEAGAVHRIGRYSLVKGTKS